MRFLKKDPTKRQFSKKFRRCNKICEKEQNEKHSRIMPCGRFVGSGKHVEDARCVRWQLCCNCRWVDPKICCHRMKLAPSKKKVFNSCIYCNAIICQKKECSFLKCFGLQCLSTVLTLACYTGEQKTRRISIEKRVFTQRNKFRKTFSLNFRQN